MTVARPTFLAVIIILIIVTAVCLVNYTPSPGRRYQRGGILRDENAEDANDCYIQENVNMSAGLSGSLSAKDLVPTWYRIRYNLISNLKTLLDEKVQEDDPRLLELIRRNLIPPAKLGRRKLSFVLPATNQAKTAIRYFNSKKKGFFIECGGFDGERSSNTLPLEILGWEGLLIEADPFYFFQSLGKNRKAWLLNAAISPTNFTSILEFNCDNLGGGVLKKGGKSQVPSFPLSTIMRAMGRRKIDFLSLDVEGLEFEVMKSFPHKLLEICAFTMEYDHIPEKIPQITAFLEAAGYRFYQKIDFIDEKITHYTHDLFFVRRQPCSL